MRLAHCTWPQAERYFRENDTVLIGVGSVECHGRHLPLGTDAMIPDHLIALIEKESDVMIVPSIPYGVCDGFADFPGTINLGAEVFYSLLSKVTDSLFRHGARKFVVLNGHGGNVKTIERIGYELQRRGALLADLNWWLMAWDMNPAWKGGHGGAEETAAILAIDPDLVDKAEIGGPMKLKDLGPEFVATGFTSVRYKGVSIEIPRLTPSVTDNGWIGPDHPGKATIVWGEEMLAAVVDYIADFIEEFRRMPLPVA